MCRSPVLDHRAIGRTDVALDVVGPPNVLYTLSLRCRQSEHAEGARPFPPLLCTAESSSSTQDCLGYRALREYRRICACRMRRLTQLVSSLVAIAVRFQSVRHHA